MPARRRHPRYVRLCLAGRLDLRSVLGSRYRLTNIERAFMDIKSGRLTGQALVQVADGHPT